MKENQMSKAKTSTLVKRLVREYLFPYKVQLFFAILLMSVAAGMTASIAALMQPILDDVLNKGKEELIAPVALALAFVFSVRGITTYFHTILMNKIGQYIVADIQRELFSHCLHMDLSFFHKNSSGNLISRVVSDVNVMRVAVTDSLTGFGKSLFTLVFLIGVMFYRDWVLTLAAFVVFPLLSIFVIYIGKRLRKLSKSIQNELGGLSSLLSQSFHGVRLVKSYGMEDHEARRVGGAINKVRDLNIKSVRLSNLSTPVNEVIIGFIFAAIIIYGGYSVLSGHSTAGQLVSFIAAFTLAYEPMKKLAKLNNALQMGLGAADRVFSVLDQKPDIQDKTGAGVLDVRAPNIGFDNVGFSYDDVELKALKGITFSLKSGTVTALVGPSGGGKTTIMNLIPRFYDVSEGRVEIDGVDTRDVTMASLRDHIALVSQDITLFDDSVLENIRYGKSDASDEDVYAAAKLAAAHDFVLSFENGYQTVVGEDGMKLSGGQRQRISIARAILRDAPILLLDEATSALDNESEKLVQDALMELEKGRTTLVIAHRLSTVQNADNIIVLDQGAIVEQGTHGELLKLKGLYASMYKMNMKEDVK